MISKLAGVSDTKAISVARYIAAKGSTISAPNCCAARASLTRAEVMTLNSVLKMVVSGTVIKRITATVQFGK